MPHNRDVLKQKGRPFHTLNLKEPTPSLQLTRTIFLFQKKQPTNITQTKQPTTHKKPKQTKRNKQKTPPHNHTTFEQAGALKIFQKRQDKCLCHSGVPRAGCWPWMTRPGADHPLPVSTVVSRPALYHVPCVALEWILILISCLIAQFSIHLLVEPVLCQPTMCFSIILLHC